MSAEPLVFDPLSGHLKRAAIGDKMAAKALVLALSPKLFRVAFRILNNQSDAEEVVQETLIKLWKIANDWQVGRAKIETWCYRVISNLCFDRLRAQNRYVFDELDENIAGESVSGDAMMLHSQIQNQIDLALAKLPTRQKIAVILTYFEGQSAKEVAQSLDTSIEAVESLLSRAKKGLKKILIDQDPDFEDNLLNFAIV